MRNLLLISLLFYLSSACLCHAEHKITSSFTRPISIHPGGSSTPPSGRTASSLGSRSPSSSNRWASVFGSNKQHDTSSNDVPTVEEPTEELSTEQIDAFLTRDSRQRFISKVYFILSLQLSVTMGFIFLFSMNPAWGRFIMRNPLGIVVPILSLVLSTIAWFMVHSSVKARREAPMKWQLLSVFTLGESVVVGLISSLYKFKSVLLAIATTVTATVGISAYTLLNKNPKYDLSQWGAGLSSAGLIFLVYSVLHILETSGILPAGFLPYNEMGFGMLGAVLFCFYLAYHTKLIVAGKHSKYQMNEKDEVYAAMTLYEDIINIFIYILRILGDERE